MKPEIRLSKVIGHSGPILVRAAEKVRVPILELISFYNLSNCQYCLFCPTCNFLNCLHIYVQNMLWRTSVVYIVYTGWKIIFALHLLL